QQLAVRVDPRDLQWANRRLVDFIPVAELQVTGLGARYRHAGIGAPLAADTQPNDPEAADYLPPAAKLPVTAFLRIDRPRAQLTPPVIAGSPQISNVYGPGPGAWDGGPVPLELEPSAALAYGLSHSRVWDWELRGFLVGDLLGQEKIRHQLEFVEPYRP